MAFMRMHHPRMIGGVESMGASGGVWVDCFCQVTLADECGLTVSDCEYVRLKVGGPTDGWMIGWMGGWMEAPEGTLSRPDSGAEAAAAVATLQRRRPLFPHFWIGKSM